MLLYEFNGTEFRFAKVSDGLVLIMKRGQMSITMPVNPDTLDRIIGKLREELTLINVKYDDKGTTRSEMREIANKATDRYKDK